MGQHETARIIYLDIAISDRRILHAAGIVPTRARGKKKSQEQQTQNQMTTWKYQELKATGFSTYIGKPIEELEQHFGKPYDRLTSGFGFETRYYQDIQGQWSFEAISKMIK